MTKILVLITNWLKTMEDKSQAKLDVQAALQWLSSWNPQNAAIIEGTEQIPALTDSIASIPWCKQMYAFLTSIAAMQPGEFKGVCNDITLDLQKSVTDISAEIGTMTMPPKGATPSQTAALACASAIKKIAVAKSNFPEIQAILAHTNEMVEYINKIPKEAVDAASK